MELRALALTGDSRFEERVKLLEDKWPIDKAAFGVIYYNTIKDQKNAMKEIRAMARSMREHVWCRTSTVDLAFNHINAVISTVDSQVEAEAKYLAELFDLLEEPLPAYFFEVPRIQLLAVIAKKLTPQYRLKALEEWGDDYPFKIEHLEFRAVTFKELSDPRLPEAEAELQRCRDWQ